MAQPLYGAREGLADRLAEWVERLGKDKSLPWAGLGLIADLKTAAAILGGRNIPPAHVHISDEPGRTWEEWETEFQKTTEYDL